MVTEAKEKLKADIESIEGEKILEKVRIYIMGMQVQENLERSRTPPEQRKKSYYLSRM